MGQENIKLIAFNEELYFVIFITFVDSVFSHDHRESTWETSRDYDDDFTRHVAYQPPQVSTFNVVIDPTRKQARKKNVKTL